jgi:hypothetical protein
VRIALGKAGTPLTIHFPTREVRESARAVGELLAEPDRAVWEHGRIAVVVDDEDVDEV